MTVVELATLEDTAEKKIAGVTLNRPNRLNAIDGSLIEAMDDVLDVLSTGEFRAAILTGAGRSHDPVPMTDHDDTERVRAVAGRMRRT